MTKAALRRWFGGHVKVWMVTLFCVSIAWFATKLLMGQGALRVPTFLVYDALLRHRAAGPAMGAAPDPAQATCVIVGLEERDIRHWGKYPISDGIMADLLEQILKGNPAAVGLDIYRDLPQTGDSISAASARAERQRLEKIFVDNQNIVVPQFIGPAPAFEVPPPQCVADSPSQIGITDVKPDADDVVRRAFLYEDDRHGNTRYSLAALLAARAMPDGAVFEPSDDGTHFQIGKTTYPQLKATDGPYLNAAIEAPRGFQIPVDFRVPRQFPEVSAMDVLGGKLPGSFFLNKVVLIGTWNFSVKDLLNTPMGDRLFGVEFHADVADQLIRAARAAGMAGVSGAPLRQWSLFAQNIWLAMFCALGAAIAWGVRPPGRYFAGIVGVSMVGVAAAFVIGGLNALVIAAFNHNLWIPSVAPLLGFLIGATLVTVYSSVSGRLDRRAMMTLFSWCVAEEVATEIWNQRESIFTHGELKPRRMRATMLFTDLVGFSSRAEGTDPEVTMQWLKEYFEEIAGLVIQERGNINKFNGDQIVAIFGPPIEHDAALAADDARNAVRCALRMRERLAVLNAKWGAATQQTRMRVGIHSGWVVAGSLGTRGRLEWTVIGNDVNVAARLESTHKSRMDDEVAPGGCRILISRRTLKMLDDSFAARPFGVLRLKGLARRMRVYAVNSRVESKTNAETTIDRAAIGSPGGQVESS